MVECLRALLSSPFVLYVIAVAVAAIFIAFVVEKEQKDG